MARVPLKEMVGYLNQLRALTGGRGTFVMSVDGFEKNVFLIASVIGKKEKAVGPIHSDYGDGKCTQRKEHQ